MERSSSRNGACEQRRPGPNEEDGLRQDQRAEAMDVERRAREDEDRAEQTAGGAVERKRAWQRMPAPPCNRPEDERYRHPDGEGVGSCRRRDRGRRNAPHGR